MSRHCLDCGMEVTWANDHCPKCDALLSSQTDGSVLHIDIAHHGETLTVAMQRLADALAEASASPARALRVVVGGGLIRTETMGQLSYLRHVGDIIDFDQEPANKGAFMVLLKASPSTKFR